MAPEICAAQSGVSTGSGKRKADGCGRSPPVLSKFYGQATKGARWMPWRKMAMKDVASCDKPRLAASRL